MGGGIFSHFFRQRVLRVCASAAIVSLALSASPASLAASPPAASGPDCSRPYTLALHDHGLLYSSATDTGIDKDFADELIRRAVMALLLNEGNWFQAREEIPNLGERTKKLFAWADKVIKGAA